MRQRYHTVEQATIIRRALKQIRDGAEVIREYREENVGRLSALEIKAEAISSLPFPLRIEKPPVLHNKTEDSPYEVGFVLFNIDDEPIHATVQLLFDETTRSEFVTITVPPHSEHVLVLNPEKFAFNSVHVLVRTQDGQEDKIELGEINDDMQKLRRASPASRPPEEQPVYPSWGTRAERGEE